LLSSTIDPRCLQGIGPPAWSITPSASQIALPFLQKDDDQRRNESSSRIQQAAPFSNTTTSLLCNVQDCDTQMQGFLDMRPWCEYPTTATSFNTVAPILEQRNFPDTDNSFLAGSRIECGLDTQLRAAPQNVSHSKTALVHSTPMLTSRKRDFYCSKIETRECKVAPAVVGLPVKRLLRLPTAYST